MPPRRSTAQLEVRPLGNVLGAEVGGVDLAKPLDAGIFAALYDAYLRHQDAIKRKQLAKGGARLAEILNAIWP